MKTNIEKSIVPTLGEISDLIGRLKKSKCIFGAKFIKKDGSIRIMNAKFGVTKHLRGGGLKFDPKKYHLLTVWDNNKKEYRFISLDTVIYINFAKTRYVFMNNIIRLAETNRNF